MHVELGRAIDENEVKEKIVKHFQILFEALFFTSEI
jgi:lipoyl(octanoyl) transferase